MSEIAEEIWKYIEDSEPKLLHSSNVSQICAISSGLIDRLRTLLEERELNEIAMDRMVQIDNEKNATIERLTKENKNIVDSWNEQKEEIRSLHAGYTSANAKRDEELYFWEPYAENHLETLTGGVVIRAEWIRRLIAEESQQLREELAEEKRHAALGWEQSGKWLEENGRIRAELDQVKKERDDHLANYIIENSNLTNALAELAEKDKVLGWYADESEETARQFHFGLMKSDIGESARSILSQYKGDAE